MGAVYKYMHYTLKGSCDNAVGRVTGLWAGQPRGRSSSPGRVKNFLFSTSSRPALGPTLLPTEWVLGVLSSWVKQPGAEADHSPPTSAKVKKMWMYISSTPYVFME
jgi:hypothetical protein